MKNTGGYKSSQCDHALIKFKPKQTKEYTIIKFNKTKKNCGMVKSARCRVNFETGRNKLFTAHFTDWSDELRKETYQERHIYYPKEGDTTFSRQWKAEVSYSELDGNKKPKDARIVGFQHKNDMESSDWSSDRLISEITDLWRDHEGKSVDDSCQMKVFLIADRDAASIIERSASDSGKSK